MAMAGRSIAAARCSRPTASASSTSPTGWLTTPRRPTIPRWSRRRCSSASPPKARPSRRWRPRSRKRRDGCFAPLRSVIPGRAGAGVAITLAESRHSGFDASHRPGMTSRHLDIKAAHDPSRRTVLSRRRALGRSDRARHAAGPAVAGRRRIRRRGRRSNSATGRSATAELEGLVEVAASAFLRAGYGKDTSVALFLGNTPDHPVNFFGALKAGARIVHLSPLDGEIALSHKLADSGARVLVTSNLSALLPTALKFLDKGLLDRLIVCEDDIGARSARRRRALPDNPRVITYKHSSTARRSPRNGPRSTPTTSRCCNIPAAPRACRKARC